MKIILPILSILIFLSCQNQTNVSPKKKYAYIEGKINYKKEVDSILVDINQAVSTYIPDSDISKFNKLKSGEAVKLNDHFKENLDESEIIQESTDGFFDPSVMPLVNYWGFGYKEKKPVNKIDSIAVDSILKFVGWEKLEIPFYHHTFHNGMEGVMILNDSISKNIQNAQLDFSAIAKGYAVDVIAEFFEEKNIQNYLVEIGGELRTKGVNDKGKLWTTAISTPKINAQLNDFHAIIQVENKGIATSGNYRNFHQVGEDWYGHTINPKTGFPEKSNLLSVTVLADDCMSADGFATAMMVMGLEKAKALTEKLEYLDAFFIFANEKGELETLYTKGFEGKVVRQ